MIEVVPRTPDHEHRQENGVCVCRTSMPSSCLPTRLIRQHWHFCASNPVQHRHKWQRDYPLGLLGNSGPSDSLATLLVPKERPLRVLHVSQAEDHTNHLALTFLALDRLIYQEREETCKRTNGRPKAGNGTTVEHCIIRLRDQKSTCDNVQGNREVKIEESIGAGLTQCQHPFFSIKLKDTGREGGHGLGTLITTLRKLADGRSDGLADMRKRRVRMPSLR